jgi:hypothetical protein
MASLSNINGLFDVHSTGAILFSNTHGTSGQILRSNGNAAPTWVAASTVIGGPYLPLTGGTLSGPLSGTSANFSGIVYSSGGFRTGSTNSSYNLLTRDNNNGSYPLYCQNSLGVSGDAAIARFAYGSYGASTGTVILDIRSGTSYFNDCNLGIGTDSPDDRLDVVDGNSQMVFGGASSDRAYIQFKHNAIPVDGEELAIMDFSGYNDASQNTRYVIITAKAEDVTDGSEDGSLSLLTMKAGTATNTMTLRSGNVGIGATDPDYSPSTLANANVLLQLGGTNTDDIPEIRLAGGNGLGVSSKIVFDNDILGRGMSIFMTSATTPFGPDGLCFFNENSSDPLTSVARVHMKINRDTGNVGIGTASPFTNLEVAGSGLDSIIRLYAAGGTANIRTWEIRAVGVAGEGLLFRQVNDANNSYTNRMIIDTDGNVGIGTISPASATKLDVAGGTKSTFYTSDGGRGFKQDGVAFGSTYSNGADANGANDIGSTTNRWRDGFFSGGIYLGGTATANKLDDYEEGDFNTTVLGITATTNTVRGVYTKIGNMCILQILVTLTGISAGTGNPYISLPFTPSGASQIATSKNGAVPNINTIISGLAYMGIYGSNAQLYANTSSGGYINNTNWSDGLLSFTLSYRTV